ncbi:hypothetical protein MHTCC0001_09430 [Flavobacteriaceae bacterium MHTCC 0001]
MRKKITKEDIPALIYIIDSILTEDKSSTKSLHNISFKIVDYKDNDQKVSARTIRRVFDFRQVLKGEKNYSSDYTVLPLVQSLDVFTQYYFNKMISFEDFAKSFSKEIKVHYQNNKPSDFILNSIFKKEKHDSSRPLKSLSSILKKKRNKIFISYAHKDKKWLELIQLNLRVLNKEVDSLDVWDDTKIRAGSKWKDEIEQALSSAKIAILIISTNFLASDFIFSNELPPLLEKSENEGTVILPIIVGHCRFINHKRLSHFQSVNDPKSPLNSCTEPEIEKILVSLTNEVERHLE